MYWCLIPPTLSSLCLLHFTFKPWEEPPDVDNNMIKPWEIYSKHIPRTVSKEKYTFKSCKWETWVRSYPMCAQILFFKLVWISNNLKQILNVLYKQMCEILGHLK